jgi:hypothetical protein
MAKLEKKHYWMIGVGTAVLIAGVVIYRQRQKKKKEEEEKALESPKQLSFNAQQYAQEEVNQPVMQHGGEFATEQPPVQQVQQETFPLRFGSENESVKMLQKYLNSTSPSELKKAGVYPLIITGVWDEATEAATLASTAVNNRNEVDEESFKRIMRDMLAANIA